MSAGDLSRGEHRGQCPECEGEAKVYPTENGRGHVYCEEDGCGWVHRDIANVARHVHAETDR